MPFPPLLCEPKATLQNVKYHLLKSSEIIDEIIPEEDKSQLLRMELRHAMASVELLISQLDKVLKES